MLDKMTPLCRRHFEINVNEWNVFILIKLSYEFVPLRPTSYGFLCQGLWLRKRVNFDQFGQLWSIWRVNCRKHFFNENIWIPIAIIMKFVLRVYFTIVSVGSTNSLVPSKRQAFICTNADLTTDAYIYAALWGNVLKENRFTKIRQKSIYAHINKENNMESTNDKYFIG